MITTERQYVVDEHGRRIAVLVPIAEYEQLVKRTPQPARFWETTDLQTLAAKQGVVPVADPRELLGDFWPSDDSVDEFLKARRAWQCQGPAPLSAEQDGAGE